MRTARLILLVAACLFHLIHLSSSAPLAQTVSKCYSTCQACSQGPYNCTLCTNALTLLDGRCLFSSREAVLASDFFPLTSDNKANISTAPYTDIAVQTCNYTEPGITSNGSMQFLKPQGTFQRTFSHIPPHSYVTLRFSFLQKNWVVGNSVTVSISNQNTSTLDYIAPPTSPNVVCGSANTTVTQIEYSFTDYVSANNEGMLSITLNSTVSGLEFGIASLWIRYGNCDKTCDTCIGPNPVNCITCKSYLTLVNGTTCTGCDSGFISIDGLCRKCHITCLTCSGIESTNCLTCQDSRNFDNTTNKCVLKDPNSVQTVEFTNMTFSGSDGWSASTGSANQSIVGKCGVYNLLLGPSIGGTNTILSKVFKDLRSHYAITIKFNLLLIDSSLIQTLAYSYWSNSTKFNGSAPVTGTMTNECGNLQAKEVFVPIKLTFNHQASNFSFRFLPTLTNGNSYGIRDFVMVLSTCPIGCKTCDLNNTNQCIECSASFIYNPDKKICQDCPSTGYFKAANGQSCQPCSVWCQTCKGPSVRDCLSCDAPLSLINGECKQDPNYGIFTMYANQKTSDLNSDRSWQIYPNLQNYANDNCSGRNMLGSSERRYKFLRLAKNITNMPAHTGITIHFNLFQIDSYTSNSLTFSFGGNLVKYKPQTFGTQLCGNSTFDAITKITHSSDHSGSSFLFQVLVADSAKLGINNIVVFLRDCVECRVQLEYALSYMPRYSLSEPEKGLDIYLDFNSKSYRNATPVHQIFIANVQKPATARLLETATPLNLSTVELNNGIVLFGPLNQSILNTPLLMTSDSPSLVTADIGGQNKPLADADNQVNLVRYDYLPHNSSDRRALRNLQSFNSGFTGAVLYLSIVSFLFGLCFLFEDFVSILQILFMHIFIESHLLPLTHKIPLSGLRDIEFLNYFTFESRRIIQGGILPQGFFQTSPHVFTQYYPDTNFIREIYPIVILNIVYLVIFGVAKLIFTFVDQLQEPSPSPYLRYYQDLMERPMSLVDSFLRYQFITVIWACLLQFFYLTNTFTAFSGINAALCIIFFIGAMLYPVAIAYYLYSQQNYMTRDLFSQLYSDIFYKRLRDEPVQASGSNQHFFYILFKFYRYFFVCLVVAVPVYFNNPVGSLVPLILIHIADLVYVYFYRVFTDSVYLGFKVVENSGLIIIEILYLVVYGQASRMSQTAFFNLGYAIDAFVIIVILNAAFRLFYILYEKVQAFRDYAYTLEMEALQTKPIAHTDTQLVGRTGHFNQNHVSHLGHHSNLSRMRF